jgi:serine/threonine-protein kinase
MGEVYLAEDAALHRRVALKRVADRLGDLPDRRDQILREGRRASRLADPRIAAVHDVLEHGGEIFLVMEYVEGVSVRERMKGPMALDAFWDLALECAKAVDAAHRQGIIHRDLKPDNVMLTDTGQVKILDFGIARRLYAGPAETTTRMIPEEERRISGTPAYMPPEAHLGKPLNEQADVFSLGVFFYELLAGRRPFIAESRSGLVNQILHEDPEPLDAIRSDVPPELARLLERMLAKQPARRPAGASEVLESLLAVRRGDALPSPKTGHPPRRGMRALWLLVPAAVVLLAALGGGERLLVRLGLRGLPENPNLAVLPFTVTGDETDRAAFGLGLADVLTAALARASESAPLHVVPMDETHEELHGLLEERESDVDADVTALAQARLGATLVLTGAVERTGDRLDVTVDLRDPASGGVLRKRNLELAVDRIPDLVRGVLDLLDVSAEDAVGISPSVAVPRTGSFYLRGRGRLLSAADSSDVAGAIRDFELAVSMDPESALALAGLARAQLAMYRRTDSAKALDEAVRRAQSAAALDPEDAEAQKTLGLALNRAEDVEGARAALARAVALNPADDEAYYEYARSYGRRRDYAAEDSLFAAAVVRRPGYWRTWWWQATSLYRQGRLEDAIVPFRKVAETAPGFYKSYENLGAIYLSLGDYADAVRECRESARLNPSYRAYSNLATAFFFARRFDDAIVTYQKALEHDHLDFAVWMNLGDAYYFGAGKPEDARNAYRNAIRLGEEGYRKRPYDTTLLSDLATIYPKVGEPDSARVRIERALGRDTNLFIAFNAALTYWQLGEPETALDYLEQAVQAGYPALLIRDSAVFDAWRDEPRFRALFPPKEDARSLSTRTQEVQHG